MKFTCLSSEQISNSEFHLQRGEAVYNTTTRRLKIGDGYTNLSELKDVEEDEYATLTTSDATATEIALIPIPDDTCGYVEVTVLGGKGAGGSTLAGKKIVPYNKEGGTLTLETATTEFADVGGMVSEASLWTTANSGDDLQVNVTGVAATDVNWKCYYKIVSHSYLTAV